MRISKIQRRNLTKRLRKWCRDPSCPICNENDWALNDEFLIELNEFIGNDYIPSTIVYCRNCGYMRLFAAPIIWPKDIASFKRPKPMIDDGDIGVGFVVGNGNIGIY